jgi:energy-coupling factor transporter ATP-binding protein EcfA2
MLTSVEIHRFRGIKEGSLSGLTPLVVLVGPNGAGKSTVLDALLISANPHPGRGIGQTVLRREEMAFGSPWLLWKRGDQGPAIVSVTVDSSITRVCQIAISSRAETTIDCTVTETEERFGGTSKPGPFQVGAHFEPNNTFRIYGEGPPLEGVPEVVFLGPFPKNRLRPLHELYSDLVRQGKREEVATMLQALVPGALHLEVLTEAGAPVLYIVFADRAVPAVLAGDGIALVLRLGFELAIREGGLVLMEEPEVHLHPGAIRQGARAIFAALRRNIQVVITTHNLELIDALLAQVTDSAELDLLSVYRFQLRDGFLKTSRLSGAEVAFARSQIEEDLR